jgi:hypothetical protein
VLKVINWEIQMSFGLDQYFNWLKILENTVKSMVLYPHLLDYTRTKILPKHPTITAEELAIQLRAPLGVAIVLLDKLQNETEEKG